MKIGVICGSHRKNSQSEKVGRYAADKLTREGLADDVFVYSLGGNPLPFWDEGIWQGEARWQEILGELREEISSCDGYVIVTPEWHGMAPAGLKNFLLMFPGSGEMAHKPALLVAVSGGGTGGAYPIAELRMSGYKNGRVCYMPEHLIVRNVGTVFNAKSEDNVPANHDYIDKRLTYCLELLNEYAKAFIGIRASGKASLEDYANGM
ncbi:MAG: NAD(P)H-dependent oxidoreductase [Pseudomonadota bacterium]